MKKPYGKRLLRILFLHFILLDLSNAVRLCREGSLYWEPHDRCYSMESRGPCPRGEILMEKPEGPLCIADYRDRLRNIKTTIRNRHRDNGIINDGLPFQKRGRLPSYSPRINFPKIYKLPSPYEISYKERECLENFQVYWEPKEACFPLLSTEACDGPDEWLVLSRVHGQLELQCQKKACPCEDLDLCEVELPQRGRSTCQKCMVYRAAMQNQVCKENEQLYINPFGVGQCECLMDPHHVKYEGKCYALHGQGPCEEGQSLQYSHLLKKIACSSELCPDTSVLHEDGHCYFLGTKGPCLDGEYFDIHPENKKLVCRRFENRREAARKRQSPVKRVFDIIPKEGQPPGCVMDSRGTCRDILDFEDSRIGKRRHPGLTHLPRDSDQPELKLMLPIAGNVRTAEDFVRWLNRSDELSSMF